MKAFICPKCIKRLKSAESLDSAVNENQKLHFGRSAWQESSGKETTAENGVEPKPDASSINICSHCDKNYDTALKLKRHLAHIQRAKKWKCNFCEYSTANVGNLVEHIGSHLNPPKKCAKKRGQQIFVKYEDCTVCLSCSICKEVSSSLADLKIHLVLDHVSQLELFCDQCDYRSFKKYKMLDHITCKHVIKSCGDMYDKERPFKCTAEGCLKRFKVKMLLNQHWKLIHSGKKLSE